MATTLKSWCIEEIHSVNRCVWTKLVSTVKIHRHSVEVLGDAVRDFIMSEYGVHNYKMVGRPRLIAPVGPAAIKNLYDYCTSEGNDFGKSTSH